MVEEIEGIENMSTEKGEIKVNISGIRGFLSNKKVQIGLTLLIFLLILISSMSIRLAGLPNLVDQTTGKYVMADPDAFYEYRVAQTIVNQGDISGVDPMRNPGLNITYTQEMLPKVLAFSYNILHSLKSSVTLDYVDVVYPIYAFAFSLIFFFLLCWHLSKSKVFALLSSLLLAYSPVYLQRTGAGISSHEALGMVFFFLTLLIYSVATERYKKNWKWSVGLGIATGISLALSLFSWAGGSNFVLMIFSVFMLTYYLFGMSNEEVGTKKKFIIFNFTWMAASVMVMPMFNYPFSSMFLRFLSNFGLLAPFSLVLMIVDLALEKYPHKIKLGQSKYRILYSAVATVILGFLGLILMGRNPVSMISGIISQLLRPFGQERVALTVAYFAQPYLMDLISNISKSIFWIFFLGVIFVGFEFGKHISSKKDRIYFYLIWILSFSGILFSRFSSSSMFNGTSFISKAVYLLAFVILGSYLFWLYINKRFHVDGRVIFLFAWMLIMLISTRSAVRVIFIVTTFVFVLVPFFFIKSYEYGKKSKDELLKYVFYFLSAISLILILAFVFGNPVTGASGTYQAIAYSASHSGPITNDQWQKAMSWVRESTPEDSVFVHWWDYGFLVQTLGERTTIVDGGNSNVYWDHMVGRYVLTESNPDATLSFMKSHNVSYLLIDPTDLGKYPAYSKIGSDDNWDRFSVIQPMVADSSQTRESNSSTIRIYQGGTGVDEDIIYDYNGTQLFLPGPTYDNVGNPNYNSVMIGAIVETSNANSQLSLKQPNAVFVYNNVQRSIPIRYAYFDGNLVDFKTGINAAIMIVPSVSQGSSGNLQIDPLGAAVYLSNKTMNGLFVQLYLMGDPLHKYPTIKLVNKQDDYIVNLLKQQGANIGSFIYFNGFRSPLEIWQVDYPSNIIAREEFTRPSGKYAEFDDLTFTA